MASAVRPGAGAAGDSTRDTTEDAGLAEADDSFSSNASFECSLSYNPPARLERVISITVYNFTCRLNLLIV